MKWSQGLILITFMVMRSAWADGDFVEMSQEQEQHLDIRTANPQSVSALPLSKAPGRIVLPPAKEFAVTSTQPGVITRVNVAIGVKVTRGQGLAEIDSIALVDIKRGLVDANSVYGVAEAKFKRDETLLREGVIAKVRWQETFSDFERAKATLRAAEQTLLASGLTLKEIAKLKSGAQIDGVYQVVSPTDGVVLDRMAIVGQRVDALSPLFRIGRLDELWLEVDMPQERLKEARIGDVIHVETPRSVARIIEIGQSVNAQSQTALVRALVEAGADQLRPGMQVSVMMMHRSTDSIFKVPSPALFTHEGRHYVFVKREGGFRVVEVAVAGEESYNVVLHEGLVAGDEVVVQGVSALKSAWMGSGESHH
jgi:cobalt-zinc-cadmium efflux system membrane fusion protein